MRKHRGLSAVVGSIFLIAVVISALSYVTYSMDQLGNFSETLVTEEKRQQDKQKEAFEITSIDSATGKLDGVISNTGQIPLEIKSLWIEEVGVPNSMQKFEINETVSPGNEMNLLDSIDFDIISTSGYNMKVISGRGDTQTFYINSVGSQNLLLTSRTTPATVSNGFDTTVHLTVTNNSTNNAPILNLTPETPTVDISACTPDCEAVLTSGPKPTSYPSLNVGETTTFSWIYTVDGIDANTITFTTSLQNGVTNNNATSTVEVRDIVSALESGTALTSQGLQSNSIDSSVLLLHEETDRTPDSSYQMFSASPEGGPNGDRIQLDSEFPNFFTQNGSSPINIPAGDWVTSLRLQSEAMPTSLKNEGENMIFHFNTNSAIQDNSQGTSSLDLEVCGTTTLDPIFIVTSTDDAEQNNPTGSTYTTSWDLEMPYDGSSNQYIGMRFQNVQIPIGATITEAYITFKADNSDSSSIILKLDGEATSDSTTFGGTNNLSPSTRTRTTASVEWTPSPWTNNLEYSTPSTLLNPVIQEIIEIPGWASGNDINLFVERVSASSGEKRRADTINSGDSSRVPPSLTVSYTLSAASPTYFSEGGPHDSGAYRFDGSNQCFRSTNTVTSSNNIASASDTTSLWFRTLSTVGVRDQYLVAWGDSSVGAGDYYRIYLEGGTGLIVFEFNLGGSHTSTCTSTSRYDDSSWYHVTGIRTGINDNCTLVITDLLGATLESFTVPFDNTSNSVDIGSTRWYVGSNTLETGAFFNGYIDDVIHWNSKALSTSPEVSQLSRTNYGTGAHQLELEIEQTDEDGVYVSDIFSSIVDVPFYDPLAQGDDVDSSYGTYNFTIPLGAIDVPVNQRLNFSINYIDSTSTWNALEVDMKIDDEDMSPWPSFIQIPPPDTPFPSYWVYDKSNRLEVSVFNLGPQGSWFVYQGTRAVFDSPVEGEPSYAAIICSVNSTESNECSTGSSNDEWRVHEHRDSIYIPVNDTAKIYFWDVQDRPDRDQPGGTEIPAGEYDMYVFIDGYDEQGAKFLRNLEMGRVKVQD